MCIDWLQCAALCRLHICFVKIPHFHRYLINIFLIYGYTVCTHQQGIFLTFIIRVSGATKIPEITYAKLYFANLRYSGVTNEQKILNMVLLNFNI